MSEARRETLRRSFDAVAERYARVRPGYPPAVLAALGRAVVLGPGCRVLEIGPGTGQATRLLAESGCAVLALELGAELARVARRELRAFPRVQVVVGEFESWPLPRQRFDLVFAATAFHWLDPALRVHKSAEALRPGGVLATLSTSHVAGGDREFFRAVQECYLRWDPDTRPGLELPESPALPRDEAEILASPQFAAPVFERFEQDASYTTAEYLDLLQSYSGHIVLPEPNRTRLLEDIAALLDARFGGRITKRYLHELRLATKRG